MYSKRGPAHCIQREGLCPLSEGITTVTASKILTSLDMLPSKEASGCKSLRDKFEVDSQAQGHPVRAPGCLPRPVLPTHSPVCCLRPVAMALRDWMKRAANQG